MLPGAAGRVAADEGGATPDAGYSRTLWQGDLTGWSVVGGRARLEEGLLALQGSGWLIADSLHADFSLSFEWSWSEPCGAMPPCLVFRAPETETLEADRRGGFRLAFDGRMAGGPAWADRRSADSGGAAWNAFRLAVYGDQARWEDGAGRSRAWQNLVRREGRLAVRFAVPGDHELRLRNASIVEPRHQSLFDGASLDQWEGAGAAAEGTWQAEDGVLLCTGEPGPWLRSRPTFGDFNLRLQYRLHEGGNSGVYVRVPADGNHHGPGSGIEVQILDDAAERYRDLKPYQYCGSLYAIVPADPRVGRAAGEWNTLEIDCRGQNYRVRHNGQWIVVAGAEEFPELAERRLSGYLGLQNHQEPVYFRHLRLAELPARE